MARKDASLELRKARSTTGQLELNQAEVVRYEAILVGASMPPRLAVSPDLLTLPASWASQPNRPIAALAGAVVLEGSLASTTAPECAMVGAFIIECGIAASNQQPVPVIAGEYDINVFRGPSAAQESQWERAGLVSSRVASTWERPELARTVGAVSWQEAEPANSEQVEQSAIMPQRYELARSQYQEGLVTGHDHGQQVEHLAPGHAVNRALWVEGDKAGMWQVGGYRNPPRFDKVWQADQWSQGDAVGLLLYGRRLRLGLPLWKGWRDGWEEAMQPGPGTSPDPKPPIIPERPDKRTLRLEFGRKRGEAELEFVWYPDNTVVIPTRRVYFVINTASVVRARDGKEIPVSSVDLSLDEGSWAWSFSANVIRHEDAKAIYNEEIDITVNGHHWRFKVDSWRRSRSFNQHDCQVSGRGLSAYLSSTYLIPNSYTEPAARNMQQLAVEELPQGWSLTWAAPDWLVPGGTFSYEKKAPIDVIQTLAEAAGATLLPGQSSKTIEVIPRYKVLPWQLQETAPDIVIPSAIMVTMGEQYHDGQNVNGVWVSSDGNTLGPCLVKRQGSGADRLLPDVMNPLMVDVVGIRALGSSSLAEAGARYDEDIELPLSQDTGLILPGRIVQTDEGKGYSRGIKISVKRGQNMALSVRQSITIERPEV